MIHHRALMLPALVTAVALVSACGHRQPAPAKPTTAAANANATAAATPAPDKSAAAAPAPDKAAIQKVEDDGKKGEVRGTPSADSKFTALRMGMSMKEVTKLLGAPTDKHSYITGKGFYWSVGSDTYRQEFIYKGQGRLTFASNGGLSMESHLIRIIHNADEKGTRS